MQHFRNRDDLVAWLETRPLRKAIARAMQEGIVEVVGGFYIIPPIYLSGWIVWITSIHKRTWILAIIPDKLSPSGNCKIRTIDEIPWKHWSGGNTTNSLYVGDHPEEYRRLKDAENK